MATLRESADLAQVIPASQTPGAISEQWGVPVLQSLTGGLFVGAVAALVTWFFFTEDKVTALKVGAIVALVVAALLYLTLLADARRLLWARYEPVSLDVPAPTMKPRERLVLVNAPRAETVTARLQEQADTARQSRFAEFVKACEASTARRSLLGAGFSESELAEFTAALRRLGMPGQRRRCASWLSWPGQRLRLCAGWAIVGGGAVVGPPPGAQTAYHHAGGRAL